MRSYLAFADGERVLVIVLLVVAVFVAVAVFVGDFDAERVAVDDFVAVFEAVGVFVADDVPVGDFVGVTAGVTLRLGVPCGVLGIDVEAVGDGVDTGVCDTLAVDRAVAETLSDRVLVDENEALGVRVNE